MKTLQNDLMCTYNLVPRVFALGEAKTLVGAGHVSRGFRVINLKFTVGGVAKERTCHN